jgi:hypothetical protein
VISILGHAALVVDEMSVSVWLPRRVHLG